MRHLFSVVFVTFIITIIVPRNVAAQVISLENTIRAAIPKAASIEKTEWEKLAKSPTTPKVSDLENQPLALLIMDLPVSEKLTPEELNEFSTKNKIPKPSELANAFKPSIFHLYITPLQNSYIKELTVEEAKDSVSGVITFEAQGVYAGKIHYSAKQSDGSWHITEFRLPVRNLKTALNAEGKWKIGPIGNK